MPSIVFGIGMRCVAEKSSRSSRVNITGFPLGVLMELTALKDYYHTKVFPVRRGVWDS